MTVSPTMTPGPSNSNEGASFFAKRLSDKESKQLAAWINEEYKKCKQARLGVERDWYQNLELYLGNQWLIWGQGALAGKLIAVKAAPWRSKLTVNRIKPIVRTELSRVTSQKPNASVVPASSEDEDLFAAQAGEQVWESTYSRLKINQTFRYSAWWMLITGVGFIKNYWDKNKKDTRDPSIEGDFKVEFLSPFHVLVPDLTKIDIEEQPYVIHAQTIPIAQAKRQYPELEFTPSVVAQNEIIDNARLHITANNKPDSCLILEMWLKPGAHDLFPEGGLCRVIDDHVVEDFREGMPYIHNEFPFIKFEHIPTGKFYSESVIKDLKPLQLEYNRTRSQIIDAKNRMSKPQLTAVEGSVDPSRITSEPGQVVLYKPGFNAPQPLPLQGLPTYVLQELERILMDMEDISAQHQVSKGNTPPGVTAATAISYLQEKDDSVLSHTYTSIEEGFEKLARQLISLAVQFWTIERTIKVTGTDGAFDSMMLKGSDLSNATDIRMEAGSALPVSKAARQAFIMDMMKLGFIPPEKGLELMEIGGVQKLYEELKIDERHAQRENLRMKTMDPQQLQQHNAFRQQVMMMQQGAQQSIEQQTGALQGLPPDIAAEFAPQPGQADGNLSMVGQDPSQVNVPGMETDPKTGQPLMPGPLVPVNTWDNHAVHIEVHNRFRKSQAFEVLSQDIKDLFEEHVSLHSQALMESAMGAGPGSMGVPSGQPNGGGQMPPPSPQDTMGMQQNG